eukprot:3746198-Rhodomonas_salina.1
MPFDSARSSAWWLAATVQVNADGCDAGLNYDALSRFEGELRAWRCLRGVGGGPSGRAPSYRNNESLRGLDDTHCQSVMGGSVGSDGVSRYIVDNSVANTQVGSALSDTYVPFAVVWVPTGAWAQAVVIQVGTSCHECMP